MIEVEQVFEGVGVLVAQRQMLVSAAIGIIIFIFVTVFLF